MHKQTAQSYLYIKAILLALNLMLSAPVLAADVDNTPPEFAIENYRGKVVYVDFWASWCSPCRASFPFMSAMAERYGESFVVVAINVDSKRKDADNFLQEFDVNFDIVFDPGGALASAFDVKGMPASFLFDHEGNLIGSHIGFRQKDAARLESAIANAVKQLTVN